MCRALNGKDVAPDTAPKGGGCIISGGNLQESGPIPGKGNPSASRERGVEGLRKEGNLK